MRESGTSTCDAFARVNDANARKIVLYLPAHEPEERGRDQILADLELDMTDQELEERLHKLVKADILADGSSNFHYRGLDDRIFAIVFRRIYGVEIERVGVQAISAPNGNRSRRTAAPGPLAPSGGLRPAGALVVSDD